MTTGGGQNHTQNARGEIIIKNIRTTIRFMSKIAPAKKIKAVTTNKIEPKTATIKILPPFNFEPCKSVDLASRSPLL